MEADLCLSEKFKNEGNIQFQLKNYNEAFDLYTKAIENISENTPSEKISFYYTNRALTCLRLSKFVEAITDCQESIKHNPNNHKAYYFKASAYYEKGIFWKSKEIIENFLKNSSNKEIVPEYTTFLTKINKKIEEIDKDEVPLNKEDKRKIYTHFKKFIKTPAIWAEGLDENERYEWLVDCYRMRVDDDYALGEGIQRGFYDPERTDLKIICDFLIFCKLAVARNMIPEDGWNWKDFIEKAKRSIFISFEKSKIKYECDNILDVLMGGRSLKYSAKVIYGFSSNELNNKKEEIYEKINEEVQSLKLKTISDINNYEDFFKNVGGVEIWAKFLD